MSLFGFLKLLKLKFIIQDAVLNVDIEEGEDGYLISSVAELPGCHSQADNWRNLVFWTFEAIELYIDK